MPSCTDCQHFRSAPYQAKHAGCYHPDHMQGKQKDAFLDEQQMPGDHELINRKGECAEFEALGGKPSLLQRIFSLGA